MKNLHPRTKLAAFSPPPASRFVPAALAVDPPPDGGYPNQNTAEGEDALFSLTTGTDNTAIGFNALFSNTTGSRNTAIGGQALLSNTTGSGNTAIGFFALPKNTIGIVIPRLVWVHF